MLANETSEHTAHEIGGQQAVWSNDLGRLCHELDYLRWADRSQRTAAWVEHTYTNDHVTARLTQGHQWALLVEAEPAHPFEGAPEPTDKVEAIRAQRRSTSMGRTTATGR